MRENGIKAHYIKPYTATTKDCDYSSQLKNILKRDFNPKEPNEAWCSDITYMDKRRWICIFNKYNGSVFKENNSMDTK